MKIMIGVVLLGLLSACASQPTGSPMAQTGAARDVAAAGEYTREELKKFRWKCGPVPNDNEATYYIDIPEGVLPTPQNSRFVRSTFVPIAYEDGFRARKIEIIRFNHVRIFGAYQFLVPAFEGATFNDVVFFSWQNGSISFTKDDRQQPHTTLKCEKQN